MPDVFKAIADPTRRAILMMLVQEPSSVNTIAKHFKMSRPAVSKHIKILTASKLVDIEKDQIDGRQRNCFAQLEALKEIEDYIQTLEKFWSTKLNRLSDFLDKNDKK